MKLIGASLGVMLLSIVVIVGFGYTSVHVILKDNMVRYMEEHVNKANENFDRIIQDADRMTAIVAIHDTIAIHGLERTAMVPDMEWFSRTRQIQQFLDSLYHTKERPYIGISLLGLHGQLYKAGSPRITGSTLQEAWVSHVLASPHSVLVKRKTGVYGLSDDEQDVLSVGRAIRRYGEIQGVVVIDMDPDILKEIYRLQDISDASFVLLDEQGQEVFRSMPMAPGEGVHDHVDTKAMIVERTSPVSRWTAKAFISQDVLLKQFYRFTNEMLGIVLLIAVACVLLLSLVIGTMTRNVKGLRQAMEAVRQGNLTATPRIVSSDEIGQLSELFVSMMEQLQRLMLRIRNKEEEKREAELQALHAQINPHFLCNTLNTITFLAQMQHVPNIREVSASLTRLLRITMDHKERYITVEEELEHVRSYLTIQRFKYLDKVMTEFHVQDEARSCKTIKMIVQPIVENAIIHGIEPTGRKGIITIKIYVDSGQLNIKITDNGQGMEQDQVDRLMNGNPPLSRSRFSGIGLSNILQRLRMFYGEEGRMHVYSQPGRFTSVELILPAHAGRKEEEDIV